MPEDLINIENKITLVILLFRKTRNLELQVNSIIKNISSLGKAKKLISLVISIDHGGDIDNRILNKQVNRLKEHINVHVIHREKKLGLKEHYLILFSELLNRDYVLFIEDDIILSNNGLKAAFEFTTLIKQNCDTIGFSLYSPRYDEIHSREFIPCPISSFYMMKVPSSLGWCVKGAVLRSFLEDYPIKKSTIDPYISSWGENSIKREWYNWMVVKNKYYLYPLLSYAHLSNLEIGENTGIENLHFTEFTHTLFKTDGKPIRYDEFYQVDEFMHNNIEIDLYGSKTLYRSDIKYILSKIKNSNRLKDFNLNHFLIFNELIESTNGGLYLYPIENSPKKERTRKWSNRPLIFFDIVTDLKCYLKSRLRSYLFQRS